MLLAPSARPPLSIRLPVVLAAPMASVAPASLRTVPVVPTIPATAVSVPPAARTIPVFPICTFTVPKPFMEPLLLSVVALKIPPLNWIPLGSAPLLLKAPDVLNVLDGPICTIPALLKAPIVVKFRPF